MCVSDIEGEFKRALQQLVPMLLAPQNLVPKLINGQRVRVKELPHYFRSYVHVYRGNELPEPKSMLVVRTIITSVGFESATTLARIHERLPLR